MKIVKIGDVNLSQKQVFNGLWSKTNNNTMQYYPFKDETQEDVELAKKDFNAKNKNITGVIISVMAALPFTSKDFLKYTKNRVNITKERLIQRFLTSKDLSVAAKFVK